MKLRTFQLALAASALATLAACSDSTEPTQTTDLESADLALAVGDATAEGIGLILGDELRFGGPFAALTAPDAAVLPGDRPTHRFDGIPQNCPYDAGTTRFQCPIVTHGPMTLSRSFALLDANGQPQTAYDAATTASADFRSTVAGSIERPRWTATVTRERHFTLSGLAGAETQHVWNGTATSTQSGTHTNGERSRSYDLTISSSMHEVVVGLPHSAHPWPLSGVVSHDVTGSRSRGGSTGDARDVNRHATVTFNGTNLVDLTVGARNFTLDLETGTVTPK